MTGAMATIPQLGGRPQPLCAVYHRDLLPEISKALERGDAKVMRVIAEASRELCRLLDLFSVEAVAPTQPTWPVEPPPHRWFQNLNRPEDLDAVA
jgi:molybdopterin-guanine dinucleotide biosynthesis protein A